MNSLNREKIRELVEKIEKLELDLKEELQKTPNKYRCRDSLKHKVPLLTYIKNAPILYILTAPIIYFMIFPAIFLDISVTIYQAVNFRVYKIKRVKRSDYIVFDRHSLEYLNMLEKINCLYCSYFNGLIAYVGEIAARTELFWCPIRHAKKIAYRHSTYKDFLEYGDAKSYREYLKELRKKIQ